MNRTNNWTWATLVVAFMFASVACGPKRGAATVSPNTGPQPPRARAVTTKPSLIALHWLWLDCGQGDEKELRLQVGRAAKALEPVFVAAYRDGPPADEVEQIQGALRVRFSARKATITTGVGLSKGDLERALRLDQKEFVARGVADATASYRSQALLGLGLVGSETALATLETVAADPTSPFRPTATRALKR